MLAKIAYFLWPWQRENNRRGVCRSRAHRESALLGNHRFLVCEMGLNSQRALLPAWVLPFVCRWPADQVGSLLLIHGLWPSLIPHLPLQLLITLRNAIHGANHDRF